MAMPMFVPINFNNSSDVVEALTNLASDYNTASYWRSAIIRYFVVGISEKQRRDLESLGQRCVVSGLLTSGASIPLRRSDKHNDTVEVSLGVGFVVSLDVRRLWVDVAATERLCRAIYEGEFSDEMRFAFDQETLAELAKYGAKYGSIRIGLLSAWRRNVLRELIVKATLLLLLMVGIALVVLVIVRDGGRGGSWQAGAERGPGFGSLSVVSELIDTATDAADETYERGLYPEARVRYLRIVRQIEYMTDARRELASNVGSRLRSLREIVRAKAEVSRLAANLEQFD